MRNIRRVILAIFVLLLVLAILVFVLENQQSVSLLFLGGAAPELPLSVVAMTALLVGMIIGPLILWFAGANSQRRRK
ncbi:Protein of unknown function [Pseudomonas reinekei]|uniref:DUF1049 domain-containing protein n=1 Tax=Pseudomonas reinekei TaxID=395598 RepID=A0A1H0JUH1_PSERE|nr:lipopolysaccharide assembly protein LapA domain-containing protein [Pseudomonas reinekei]KAB0485259.1 DUF1049 domain-containing protein [Pseudomonas reinekei]OLU01775.1 hypothetical protein BVK86_15975 [Pseudomonas reinekei]SDO47213.1 Protein of unknown function [Pseudomonas reinekei]